jgi:proline iminopeptidase
VTIVDVNGSQLFMQEFGSGPIALVLHGGLGVAQQLYRSLDALATMLHLVYIDHRGNGRSSRPDPDTLTMTQWADDAAAVAALVGNGEPVIVIGHSFGGFIAQELAISHPAVVRALILVATTPGQLGRDELPAPAGPPIPDKFAALLATMPATDGELAAGMADLAPAYLHIAAPELLTALMADTIFSAVAMRRGFEELATWSSVDRLAAVGMPVLVIAGRHDAFTAWPQAERIANRLPDGEVIVFENSAHFPWLDEPAAFFDALMDWLNRRQLIQ